MVWMSLFCIAHHLFFRRQISDFICRLLWFNKLSTGKKFICKVERLDVKQCRSWWDGSWWAVSSGSTLFAKMQKPIIFAYGSERVLIQSRTFLAKFYNRATTALIRPGPSLTASGIRFLLWRFSSLLQAWRVLIMLNSHKMNPAVIKRIIHDSAHDKSINFQWV